MNKKALEITKKLEQMIYAAGHYYTLKVEPDEDQQFNRILAFATGYTIAIQDIIEGRVNINIQPVDWLGEKQEK